MESNSNIITAMCCQKGRVFYTNLFIGFGLFLDVSLSENWPEHISLSVRMIPAVFGNLT